MIARLENNSHNVYNDSGDLIGKIKIKPKSGFNEAEILLDGKNYKINHDKWSIKVSENDRITHNLKMNSFPVMWKFWKQNKRLKVHKV